MVTFEILMKDREIYIYIYIERERERERKRERERGMGKRKTVITKLAVFIIINVCIIYVIHKIYMYHPSVSQYIIT